MEHQLQLPMVLTQHQQSQSASHSRKATATLMHGEAHSVVPTCASYPSACTCPARPREGGALRPAAVTSWGSCPLPAGLSSPPRLFII